MNYFQHSVAYRHHNGDVEGFRGYSKNMLASDAEKEVEAREDCFDQIRKKIAFIKSLKPDFQDLKFEESNNIIDRTALSEKEWANVQRDWKTNLRY